MKTSKVTLSVFAMFIAAAIAITSCKKKDPEPSADTDTSSASDNSLAERTADDIENMISVGDSGVSYYRTGDEYVSAASCGSIFRDTGLKKVTITFNGQQCLDGHTRSGTLVFDYSQSTNGAMYYRNPGFKAVVTSSNYTIDGNAVTVNKTITNTTAVGFNPATTNMTWSVSATISIAKSNGTVSWTTNKVKTLLNTNDTNVYHGQAIHITWSKAKVGITGSSSGTTAGGESFTASITSQLVRDFTCSPNASYPARHPFIQGKFEFTPGTKYTRYFDYGSGACDDNATVTINGNTYSITLP